MSHQDNNSFVKTAAFITLGMRMDSSSSHMEKFRLSIAIIKGPLFCHFQGKGKERSSELEMGVRSQHEMKIKQRCQKENDKDREKGRKSQRK